MAALSIAEYAQVGLDGIPVAPPNAIQSVTVAAASNASSAFAANTNFVVMSTDTITALKFGAAPTAAATDERLPTGVQIIRRVAPGTKVANFQTT